LWTKTTSENEAGWTAENSRDFLRFSAAKPAVGPVVNWYTFESLAGEIRTVRTIHYYHHQE
jgi:hypothetical protein